MVPPEISGVRAGGASVLTKEGEHPEEIGRRVKAKGDAETASPRKLLVKKGSLKFHKVRAAAKPRFLLAPRILPAESQKRS